MQTYIKFWDSTFNNIRCNIFSVKIFFFILFFNLFSTKEYKTKIENRREEKPKDNIKKIKYLFFLQAYPVYSVVGVDEICLSAFFWFG